MIGLSGFALQSYGEFLDYPNFLRDFFERLLDFAFGSGRGLCERVWADCAKACRNARKAYALRGCGDLCDEGGMDCAKACRNARKADAHAGMGWGGILHGAEGGGEGICLFLLDV